MTATCAAYAKQALDPTTADTALSVGTSLSYRAGTDPQRAKLGRS